MTLRVDQIRNSTGDESVTVEAKTDMAPVVDGTLFLAARQQSGSVAQFFNGRIEAPTLCVDGVVVERWNLADEMTSLCVPSALVATGHELQLVNAPVRAVVVSGMPVKCAGNTNPSIMPRSILMRMPSMILAGRPAFPSKCRNPCHLGST